MEKTIKGLGPIDSVQRPSHGRGKFVQGSNCTPQFSQRRGPRNLLVDPYPARGHKHQSERVRTGHPQRPKQRSAFQKVTAKLGFEYGWITCLRLQLDQPRADSAKQGHQVFEGDKLRGPWHLSEETIDRTEYQPCMVDQGHAEVPEEALDRSDVAVAQPSEPGPDRLEDDCLLSQQIHFRGRHGGAWVTSDNSPMSASRLVVFLHAPQGTSRVVRAMVPVLNQVSDWITLDQSRLSSST